MKYPWHILAASALFVGVVALPGAANAHGDEMAIKLVTKHKSPFSKIRYRLPKNWVVEDGESEWVAPSHDKMFGQPGFDIESDPYYEVGGIPAYLSLEDRQKNRVRSIEEIVNATAHSLKIAAKAEMEKPPLFFKIDGRDAGSIFAKMDGGQVFYQVFVRIADNELGTVAGTGPSEQLNEIRPLVDAIASTIKSGAKK